MRRLLRFLLRNWPLKLAAVLLATMLYSGLVLSQSVRTFSGSVPVDPIRPPPGATLLADIEPVREVRYRAPIDVGILSPDSFRATVDLSRVEPRQGGEVQDVAVTLDAIDRRIQVVEFSPRTVQVRLDFVQEREMPVSVVHNAAPEGLSIGTPQTDPSVVNIRGASSRVSAVRSVVARVTIDASALNIDRDVELIAIDNEGNEVPNLEIQPTRANVRIAVAVELANKTLPVVPQIVGELDASHVVSSVVISPLTVTVSGSESVVTRLETALTEPIDITGRTRDFETLIGLALPDEVSVIGSSQVSVTVGIAEVRGSRTFLAGVTLDGASAELTYRPAVTQVAITLEGLLAELDSVNAAQLLPQVQVAELEPGPHLLPIVVNAPAGLQLISVSPAEVLVRVEQADEGGGRLPLSALAAVRL